LDIKTGRGLIEKPGGLIATNLPVCHDIMSPICDLVGRPGTVQLCMKNNLFCVRGVNFAFNGWLVCAYAMRASVHDIIFMIHYNTYDYTTTADDPKVSTNNGAIEHRYIIIILFVYIILYCIQRVQKVW